MLRLRLRSGAILRDDDREYLANQVMEDDGPDEIDPNLLRVIKDLTAAVKAIKAPRAGRSTTYSTIYERRNGTSATEC